MGIKGDIGDHQGGGTVRIAAAPGIGETIVHGPDRGGTVVEISEAGIKRWRDICADCFGRIVVYAKNINLKN